MFIVLYYIINVFSVLIYIIKIPFILIKFLFRIIRAIIIIIIQQFKKDGVYSVKFEDGSYQDYILRDKSFEGEYVNYIAQSNTLIRKLYRWNDLVSMKIEINNQTTFELGYDKFEKYQYNQFGENEKTYYRIRYKMKYFYDEDNNLTKTIKSYNPKDFESEFRENIFQITKFFNPGSGISYIENKIKHNNFIYKQYVW